MRTAALTLALSLACIGAARADDGFHFYSEEAVGFANLADAGGHSNGVTGGGAALFAFDNPGVQAQLSGGVAGLSGSGGGLWSVDGDLFWRDAKGAIGGSFSYARVTSNGFLVNVNSYGGFGEWYLSRDVSLRIGGVHFNGHGENANFVSGGAVFYVTRSLALDATASYGTTRFSNSSASVGASVEYMFDVLPFSIAAGGSYNTAGGNGHELFVALKFRTGPGSDLEDYQRRGALDWNGGVSPTSVL